VRITFDTNVLVYVADRDAGERHLIAVDLMRRARGRDCVVSLQALAELFRTLTGRYKLPAAEAIALVDDWRNVIPVIVADEQCLIDAMDAVAGHQLAFWDAMIWATARRAGCRLLLSEDGQDGRTLGGVTIVNPFVPTPSPLLAEALGARN
jgi:predicted nucleic acid-binding protein